MESTAQIRKSHEPIAKDTTDLATDMATSSRNSEPLFDICYDNFDALEEACRSPNMMTIWEDDDPSTSIRYPGVRGVEKQNEQVALENFALALVLSDVL